MITYIGRFDPDGVNDMRLLSSDTKPVTHKSGSTALEHDTGDSFEFDENNINPITGTGWWKI